MEQELKKEIEELKNKFEEFSKKFEDSENKLREAERVIADHTHSGIDGSKAFYNDSIILKPGERFQTGKMSMEEFSNEVKQVGGFVVGNNSGQSGLANKLKSTQITIENQQSTDTTTNQTFLYGFRYPVYNGAIAVTATATGTTLTQTDFTFIVNELSGAYINIYDSLRAYQYTRQIASNTATVITIDGTFPATVTGGFFDVVMPVYFGAAQYPWRQGYFVGQDVSSGGDGGQRRVLRFGMGTSAGADVIGYFFGTGTPEGVVTANVGSIFLRTDGGALTTLYVKTANTTNLGWTAK